MFFRLLLLMPILAVGLAPRAEALPIIFTDRTAFNAAVGDHALLTFDAPLSFHLIEGTISEVEAVVDGSLRVCCDLTGASVANQHPGGLTLEAFIGSGAGTVNPVMAFGADITPLTPACGPTCTTPVAYFGMAGLQFLISEPQFLGFLFTEPTSVGFGLGFVPGGQNGLVARSRILVDNVAIKTPEPSSLLFLGLGLLCLMLETVRQRTSRIKQLKNPAASL